MERDSTPNKFSFTFHLETDLTSDDLPHELATTVCGLTCRRLNAQQMFCCHNDHAEKWEDSQAVFGAFAASLPVLASVKQVDQKQLVTPFVLQAAM